MSHDATAARDDGGEPQARPHRITVIGVGNTLMGDDGVGVTVVRGLLTDGPSVAGEVPEVGPVSAGCGRHLPDALGPGVDVVLGESAGLALVKHFRESRAVIVVDGLDATAQGAQPGEIFRFTPDEAQVTALRSNTIHATGVPQLVTHARLAGADPEVIVLAVQVGDVRPRPDELSEPVAAAAVRVRELVADELARLTAASS
jgi:hydrogenase maturation protease